MNSEGPDPDPNSALKGLPDVSLKDDGPEWNNDIAAALHRNGPVPDPACLYGLIGDIARAGSDGTETNPYAIAANFIAYLSCAVGRNAYLPIGIMRGNIFYISAGLVEVEREMHYH